MDSKRHGWSLYARTVLQVSRELLVELRRLNSARLGDAHLSRLSRSEQVRMVKTALSKHHSGSTRCC